MIVEWHGNRPGAVAKDAKYCVKASGVIALLYRLNTEERTLLSTDEHPQLVAMVDSVKVQFAGATGGSFYIDEYRNVLVPVVDRTTKYFVAGKYNEDLKFIFDDVEISQSAYGFDPGDDWKGPHVGIPYVLSAGATDIYYECESRPQVILRRTLSKAVGTASARSLAARLGRIKGISGGRIYINECKEFFAPVSRSYETNYLYLGHLGNDPWFEDPCSA